MVEVLIGIAAGIIGGMGIGGGTILIPGIVFLLKIEQQTAQSINLLSFIPAAALAVFIPLIVSGMVGAVIGAVIAVRLNPSLLKKLFSGFLFIMGLYEIFSKKH